MKYLANIIDEIRFFTKLSNEELKSYDFFDICSGTGIISHGYRHRFRNVYANDISPYAYVTCSMRLEFSQKYGCTDLFNYLTHNKFKGQIIPFKPRMAYIADYLNNLPLVDGFIAQHYTTEWTEKTHFYSIENGQRIDAMRVQILEWERLGLINNIENNFLVGSLLDSAEKVANVKYRYDTAVKPWHEERLIFIPFSFDMNDDDDFVDRNNEERHCVTNFDVETTLLPITYDKSIVFFDPTFQYHDYIYQYGVPITILKYDNPAVRGLYNLREKVPSSNFCHEKKYMNAVRSSVRNNFLNNNARFFIMAVPRYDNKATFDHDKLDAYFKSLNVKKYCRRTVSDEIVETPWREKRKDSKLLVLYMLEK